MVANRNVTARVSSRAWVFILAIAFAMLLSPAMATVGGDREAEGPAAAAAEKPAAFTGAKALDSTANLSYPTSVADDEVGGVVVDADGTPLAGVLVDVWNWFSGNETTTDEHGAFVVKTDDDRGPAQMRFLKEGFSPFYIPQQPTGVKDLLVTLDNKTYIEGTVTAPNGDAIANAKVRAKHARKMGRRIDHVDVTAEGQSDEAGHYHIYLFPDTYEIEVAVPRVGVRQLKDIRVAANEATHRDILLEPGIQFVAEVIDADTGDPVQGVVLWNWHNKDVVGVSDSQGRLVIDGMLPGSFQFNVGHGKPKMIRGQQVFGPGRLGRWWSEDAVKPWQKKSIGASGWQENFDSLDFVLSPGMKPVKIEVEQGVVFSGHVYDPDGNPVAGATVAPAKTGSGNSLTGDTRYSVETDKDGSYRVVTPAGNSFVYNLVAHDGKYSQWRNWANGVSEPVKTLPGEHVQDFDLTLTRPAAVRGRILAEGNRAIGKLEVRAHAADLGGNRYYDPTARVNEDGTFELKYIRPGKHYIQVEPFRLDATRAPEDSSELVDLVEGEVREGIELRIAP